MAKVNKGRTKKITPSKFSKPNKKSLGPNAKKLKNKKKTTKSRLTVKKKTPDNNNNNNNNNNNKEVKNEKPITKTTTTLQILSAAEQRNYFLDQFQSANAIQLSSLELEPIKDTYFVQLPKDTSQDASNLGNHVKDVFGSTWKEVLCEPQIVEGKVEAGNPAVLVVSPSAIRSLEMLRGLRTLTTECQPVKLFSKHMKVDEQVAMLKKRVNIASGTPSRIKKLCEMEALGLSRLEVIVLDMHADVKGYSLLTLPQVRDEFWDLYKSHFHQRLLQGDLRVCLYGPVSVTSRGMKKSDDQ